MSPFGWVDRIATDAAWVAVGLGVGLGLAEAVGWLSPRVPGFCGNTPENQAPLLGLGFLGLRWTGRWLLRLSAWFERRLERWERDRDHRKLKTPFLDEL